MVDFEIKGGDDLMKALDALPVKLERNILRGALRAGAVPISDEAKNSAAFQDKTGELRKSIRISTGAKGGKVYSHVTVGNVKAWYARFVEFGTAPHEERPKGAKSLFFAGLNKTVVQHPGASPKPFMRPALDTKAGEAIEATAAYIRARLDKLK